MTLKIQEISRQQCFERLAGGAVLVTVNRRLARSGASRYAEFRIKLGETAWQTPDILPYGAWLVRLFHDLLYFSPLDEPDSRVQPVLMDDLQERLVWERIISESEAASRLIDVYETARMAQEAWRLCREWKVPVGDGMAWSAPDPAAFSGWAESFAQFCRQSGFLDHASLAGHLCAPAADGRISGVPELILAGFDELTPAQMDLFSAFHAAGTRVCRLAWPVRAGGAVTVVAEDDAAEIRAAAWWARRHVQADPGARIAVVSPRLAADREAVCREFEDALCPNAILSSHPPDRQMFNITAAPGLSAYPVVAAAERILDIAGRQGAEVFEWSRLLRSPFLAGAETEFGARAALDAEIRAHGDLFFPISGIIRMAGSLAGKSGIESDLRILSAVLEKLRTLARDMPARQSPDQWTETFSGLLDAAGWPGQRSLSSREYQTVSAWHQVLEAFARLAPVSGSLSGREAGRILSRMLAETPFQPEQPDVPVQIMGMLEAAGEEFDALWIMGMHHEIWPPPARPNPFVPVTIQREQGLPHSSPARELAYSRQITSRLLCCADEIICSYGGSDGESMRLASPLIDHLEQARGPETGVGYWQQMQESAEIERLADIAGADVPAGGDVPGGTGIIKSQALCPFQAYGRYRLGARRLEIPEQGLNARDRGILVHRVLELLWNQICDHQRLSAMSDRELDDTIAEAVARAIRKLAGMRPDTFTDRFTRVETDRLHNLVAEWMAQERARAPFAVKQTESRMHVRIGDIGLHAFADRIDALETGQEVIIDYKTGTPSPGDWFVERIAEPQLPVYSLGLGREPGGVLFARVRKGEAAYLGIAAADGLFPRVKGIMDDGRIAKDCQSIREAMAQWEQKLFTLAEEIRTGHAAVSPVSENKACRYCDLAPLCRVWEVPGT
ncbi:MAG: PD-(D/E)XK nuclease family protein [Desulfobacterales bacterium]